MKIFFDTEFTGLYQNATLISIGMVANNYEKSTFYAEFIDYDKEYIKNDEWSQKNVIDNLLFKGKESESIVNYKRDKDMEVKGTSEFVVKMLRQWLTDIGDDEYQLVSDVCHYDMVLFLELFGGAFGLPKYINPACHDINQDIASVFHISEKEAFDLNREEIAENLGFVSDSVNKHNALHDAKVIEYISNNLK